ncbi:hypothetical protein RchiOBHm_Chr4g0385761 [Rosa chinensis]|uniref:Uncharacterized protein n=1 Tax=Rosa chinensis TaxID=74649 RepID=A0A2P6QP32_ROSCH|nr:hypothetical protein RchiOBHm_Chr4g0385761 [Rosa chinensis]
MKTETPQYAKTAQMFSGSAVRVSMVITAFFFNLVAQASNTALLDSMFGAARGETRSFCIIPPDLSSRSRS